MASLTGKLIIEGKIRTLTGLHIGGSKTSLEIGGVDLNVIKTPGGQPFIPGSSLKGKLRSLLGRHEGKTDVANDPEYVQEMFGNAKDHTSNIITRMLVRDAHLDLVDFKAQKQFKNHGMDFDYSDVKWENKIDRKKGAAEGGLRQLERVPAGVAFNFSIVYDIYNDWGEKIEPADLKNRLQKHLEALTLALRLLQDDYLGGQGSRGYGQIGFEELQLRYKKIENGNYETSALPDAVDDPILLFSQHLTELPTHASRYSALQTGE